MNDINTIWNKDENQKSREKLLKRKLKDYGTTKSAENIAQKIIKYTKKLKYTDTYWAYSSSNNLEERREEIFDIKYKIDGLIN